MAGFEVTTEGGITEQTYYRWRKEYGGSQVVGARFSHGKETISATNKEDGRATMHHTSWLIILQP